MTKTFNSTTSLTLESGHVFDRFTLAYHTYGNLNDDRSNVVWVCHALTANSDVEEWWPGLVGKGKLIDTDRYFVICANMLGSCYGSTGPDSINPASGKPYGKDFPLITIRDMVNSFRQLADHLGIDKIYCCIGGSTGGMQVLEWGIMDADRFDHLAVLACNAIHSPWGIAFNESQRMALLADDTIFENTPNAGAKGLQAARSIAMLSYRHYLTYEIHQSEEGDGKIDDYRASSYQRYQGDKLRKRFSPWAYFFLSKAMDSHNVGRGRLSIKSALHSINTDLTVVGIDNDLLFPYQEQEFLAEHIPDAKLGQIHSNYGHDAFLIEYDQLEELLRPIFEKRAKPSEVKRPQWL